MGFILECLSVKLLMIFSDFLLLLIRKQILISLIKQISFIAFALLVVL
jgi:hypothetical protein